MCAVAGAKVAKIVFFNFFVLKFSLLLIWFSLLKMSIIFLEKSLLFIQTIYVVTFGQTSIVIRIQCVKILRLKLGWIRILEIRNKALYRRYTIMLSLTQYHFTFTPLPRKSLYIKKNNITQEQSYSNTTRNTILATLMQ